MRHSGPVNTAPQDLPHHFGVLQHARAPAGLLILTTILLFALSGHAAQLYVSTAGSDLNRGTRAKPFATLERARDEVRRLRHADQL